MNYPPFRHVTKSRGISSEVVAQQQRDQCQNFSLGHNFMDKTLKYFSRSENLPLKIIHIIDRVTTNWSFFQKAPFFIFIWLLKWSCLGHNKMNQAKNPELQVGRVDIAVGQCVSVLVLWTVKKIIFVGDIANVQCLALIWYNHNSRFQWCLHGWTNWIQRRRWKFN